GRPRLFALFQAGRFALEPAQVVELGAANFAGAHDVDVIDHFGVDREDALDAVAEADLADGDALTHARAIAGNDGAFESLEALFIAFLDFDVNLDGIAGAKRGNFLLALVLIDVLRQQRVLHVNVQETFSIQHCGAGFQPSGADPWSARDALVPLFCRSIKHLQNPNLAGQGPAADEGRPTTFAGGRLWENYAALG